MIVLGSCSESEPLELPEQRPLTTGPDFGVAESLYARIHEDPSESGRIVGHLRRGDIARIRGQSAFAEEVHGTLDFWYEIESQAGQGWVFGGYLTLFDRRARAERAADRMREQIE